MILVPYSSVIKYPLVPPVFPELFDEDDELLDPVPVIAFFYFFQKSAFAGIVTANSINNVVKISLFS